MRKRLLALALCAMMASSMAVTTAVSAKQASKPNVRQYDLYVLHPQTHEILKDVVGKITIDMRTGHYVANAHLCGSALAPLVPGGHVILAGWNSHEPHIVFAREPVNKGGNVQFKGTMDSHALDTINSWGDNAIFYVA